MPPGVTPGFRDSSHRYQYSRCAISTSFRKGGAGESTPTRSRQGHHATFAGGGNQSETMYPHLRLLGAAPTFRHSRATPQDPLLAGGSLVRMGPLRGQTTLSGQQKCRTTLGGGGAHGGIGSGSSPPLPPGATAGSRVSRTPPPTPPERETCGGRRQESIDQMDVDPVQGSTPREDNPSRRERRRAGA